MRRIFVDPCRLSADAVTIDGTDHHHLANVLRVREGDELVLLDGLGAGFRARVVSVDRHVVRACIEGPASVPPEPPVRVTVAQAVGKGDRFDEAIEHATEAGASAFIPLLTERTVVRLRGDEGEAKVARWQRIVKGAAEQSGRARIPVVEPPAGLAEVLARAAEFEAVLMLDPCGDPLEVALGLSADPRTPVPGSFLLLVGPEGGFTADELGAARQAGARVVSLGAHVLRTETAALVAVSQVLFAARLWDRA